MSDFDQEEAKKILLAREDKYTILLEYFDRQMKVVKVLYEEIIAIDNSVYDKRYVFAMKTQEFYAALEGLFKQIAKAFENHVKNLSEFHKELLVRMNTEMPKMRPAVLTQPSMAFLTEVHSFRHFIRQAYGCLLDEKKLDSLQARIRKEFSVVKQDLQQFRSYVQTLADG